MWNGMDSCTRPLSWVWVLWASTDWLPRLYALLPLHLLLCSMQCGAEAYQQCSQPVQCTPSTTGDGTSLNCALLHVGHADWWALGLACKDVHAALSGAARASGAQAQARSACGVWKLVPCSAALLTGDSRSVQAAMKQLHSAEGSICASAERRCDLGKHFCPQCKNVRHVITSCSVCCCSLLHCPWGSLNSLTVVVGPGAHLLTAVPAPGQRCGPCSRFQQV